MLGVYWAEPALACLIRRSQYTLVGLTEGPVELKAQAIQWGSSPLGVACSSFNSALPGWLSKPRDTRSDPNTDVPHLFYLLSILNVHPGSLLGLSAVQGRVAVPPARYVNIVIVAD